MPRLLAAGGHSKTLCEGGNLIGADGSADVRLRPELGIAPQHYRIASAADGWELTPLAGSLTLLNGMPVAGPTPVRSGDQITAGQVVLTFEEIAALPSLPAEVQVPPSASVEGPSHAPDEPPPLPPPEPATSPKEAGEEPPRSRVPRWALVALAVAALAGGGVATWKTGLLGGGDGGTSDTAAGVRSEFHPPATTPPIVPDEAASHFDLLAEFSPPDPDLGFTLNAPQLLSVYRDWVERHPELPDERALFDQIQDLIQFDLTGVVRLSHIVKLDDAVMKNGRLSDSVATGTFVATFARPLDPTDVQAPLPPDSLVPERDAKGERYYRLHERFGTDTRIFVKGRSLVVAYDIPGDLGADPSSRVLKELRDRGGRAGGDALIMSARLSEVPREALHSAAAGSPVPDHVLVALRLDAGVELLFEGDFAEAADAAAVVQKFGDSIGALRELAQEHDVSLPPAIVALLGAKHYAEDDRARLEIKLTRAELDSMVADAMRGAAASGQVARAKRNAQNLASVCAAAVAAGCTDFEGPTPSVEQACLKLVAGVKGTGTFGDTEFRVPNLSTAEIAAAAEHLDFDEKARILFYTPDKNPHPAAAVRDSPLPMMLRELFGLGDPPEATHRRNAQNLAAVYASATAAGVDWGDVDSAEEVVRILTTEGVSGSGDFETVVFKITNLSREQVAGSLAYLDWDREDGGLIYRPAGSRRQRAPEQFTFDPEVTDFGYLGRAGEEPEELPLAARHAQHVALTYMAASSCGAPDLAKVNDVDSAIDLLAEGVYGSAESGFDKTLFKIDPLDAAQRTAAAEYLVWDGPAQAPVFHNPPPGR